MDSPVLVVHGRPGRRTLLLRAHGWQPRAPCVQVAFAWWTGRWAPVAGRRVADHRSVRGSFTLRVLARSSILLRAPPRGVLPSCCCANRVPSLRRRDAGETARWGVRALPAIPSH